MTDPTWTVFIESLVAEGAVEQSLYMPLPGDEGNPRINRIYWLTFEGRDVEIPHPTWRHEIVVPEIRRRICRELGVRGAHWPGH